MDKQQQVSSSFPKNPFFAEALTGDNSPIKYIIGVVFTLLGWISFSSLSFIAYRSILDTVVDGHEQNNNLFYLSALLGFVGGVAGLWFTVEKIHGRPFRSIITPLRRVNIRKILLAFFIYMALTMLSEAVSFLLDTDNYEFRVVWRRFLPLLVITVLVMPFQTSFEELFFRGYLMQALGAYFNKPLWPILLTAFLFAIMHIQNPEVGKYGFWVMLPYYMGFGLLLGYITFKDASLEIALGAHAANNMFSAVFLTFEDSALPTDALFLQHETNPLAAMPFYFLCMGVFLLVCRYVFGWQKNPNVNIGSRDNNF